MTTTEQMKAIMMKAIMDEIRSVLPEKRLEGLKMLRSTLSGLITLVDLAIEQDEPMQAQEGGTHAEERQETQIPSREG